MTSPPVASRGTGAVRQFAAQPAVLQQIRGYLIDLASGSRLAADDLNTIVLAAHEAAANAIEHSGSQSLEICWRRSPDTVEVAIADDGEFTAGRGRSDDRGRGIGLLLALADRVEVCPGRPHRPGTTVRMLFRLGRGTTGRTSDLTDALFADFDPAAQSNTPAARSDRFRRAGGCPVLMAAARLALFDHAPVGIAVLDDQLRFVRVNQAMAEIHGLSVDQHVGRSMREVLPVLADSAEACFRQVLQTGSPMPRLELAGAAGTAGTPMAHWSASVYPALDEHGLPIGLALLARDVTELRQSQRDAAACRVAEQHTRRLALLQRLTAALAGALDTEQVAQVVVSTITPSLGAQASSIAEMTGESWRLLASTGLSSEVLRERRGLAAGVDNPIRDAIAARRPVLITSRTDWGRRYESLRGFPGDYSAWAVLPLVAESGPVGVVTLGWQEPRQFTASDVDLLTAVSGQAASAIQRAILFDAERQARTAAQRAQQRLILLAEATDRLAAAISETEQLACLADLLVEGFADWCGVLLPDQAGLLHRRLIRTSLAGARTVAETLVGEQFTAVDQDDPRLISWRHRTAARVESGPVSAFTSGIHPDLAVQLRAATRTGAMVSAPIVARNQVIGVFYAWRDRARPAYDADDERFIADLGRRLGVALDNSRLLAARTHVAAMLQDALLPDELPSLPGVELAAGYIVAEDAADVGGDLYDAFAVGDDGYALVIGDVTGRGVQAAGLTGVARDTLRALAGQLPPAAALARLNTLLGERAGDERFLTLAYLLVKPVDRGIAVRVWRAGHPPPIVVRHDGSHLGLGVPGPLLGVFDDVVYTEQQAHLGEGDLLLLYTDGLLEAKGPDGLFGETHLPALLPKLAGRSATEAVALVEQAVTDHRGGSADDTALLALRLTPSGEPVEQILLDLRLPSQATAMSRARHAAGTALAGMLESQRLFDVQVAISELLTNAVQQLAADPPRSPRGDPIRMRITRCGPTVRVEVSNPGPRFSLPEPEGHDCRTGRGLRLVRAVATSLGVTTRSGTTCVWFEIAVL